MAKFTIEVADAALPRLQAVVQRYNSDNGAALTVADWLTLHLRELAIQDELMQSIESIRKQKEAEAHSAALAERDRLLASV